MAIKIEAYDFKHAGLAWNFQVNPCSCGNHQHYEEYLRLCARSDAMSGSGKTHIVITDTGTGADERIAGFITLRASSYIEREGSISIGHPALEIEELAVDIHCEKQGIGKLLLEFAVVTAERLRSTLLGVQYIALCADEYAVPFYEHFGFRQIAEYGDVPRDGWNVHCIPMFLKLPEHS